MSPPSVDWTDLHGDAFRGTRVLVTGGAGFIGSHIVEALHTLGAQIVVIDDLSGGDASNIPEDVEFIQSSILHQAALAQSIKGCTFVFHEAALGAVSRSIEIPVEYHEVNTTGTTRVLDAALKAGVRRVVFAASSSAYGDSEVLPKVETMAALPQSPYAATKVAGEAMMRAYAACYPLDTASLRYFNIFGPRQNPTSAYAAVIAAFAKALHAKRKPVIHGDGEQSRDFTYVANVVHANLLAARSDKRIGGEVMNVGVGERTTVNALAKEMSAGFGLPDIGAEHVASRAGDVKHSLADISKARRLIGYEPILHFREGLRVTTDWYARVL